MSSRLGIALFWVAAGLALGTGLFTFGYARGASYLSNDPAVCANCHIMDAHFDSWARSSHRSVAVCNDCHTPHTFIGKYATKASNGFWHSFAFTTGVFPDPIEIKPHNRAIAEAACRDCHENMVAGITAGPHRPLPDQRGVDAGPADGVACTRCHRTVGHNVR
jgi:cytochrome c nitrite reductase small subunit